MRQSLRALHFLFVFVLIGFLSFSMALAADAGESPANKRAWSQLVELNKKAVAHIQARRFDAAKEVLLEALVTAKDSGLEGSKMMARTYVNLAAVYVTGEKKRDKGVNQFKFALKIDPDIVMTPELETPALKSAYLLARREMGLTENPDSAGGPAPAVPPSPAVTPQSVTPALARPAVPPAQVEPTTITKRGRGGHKVAVEIVDPDLPAKVPLPLYCPLPFEIPPGEDLVIRCLTQKQQKKSTAIFYFRPEGSSSEEFTALPMLRSPKGWLETTVSADVIAGKALGYYIQAHVPVPGGPEQTLYLAGPEAPNNFMIKEGSDASFKPDRENIMDTLNSTIADEEDTRRNHRREPGAIWFSIAAGSGVAYHGTESVDSGDTSSGFTVRSASGFAPAQLLQFEGEIGYQLGKRWSVSGMGRYQYAPADSSGYTGKPILTSAIAAYLRARYAFLTAGNFQGHVSAGAGGGKNFLVRVDKECDASSPTAGCRLTHSDTLHGGRLGVLVGVGGIYHLGRNVGVFLDVNEIMSLPKFMALTEINLGLALAFKIDKSSPVTADEVETGDKAPEPTSEPPPVVEPEAP